MDALRIDIDRGEARLVARYCIPCGLAYARRTSDGSSENEGLMRMAAEILASEEPGPMAVGWVQSGEPRSFLIVARRAVPDDYPPQN